MKNWLESDASSIDNALLKSVVDQDDFDRRYTGDRWPKHWNIMYEHIFMVDGLIYSNGAFEVGGWTT
jgi:hypothetical protein